MNQIERNRVEGVNNLTSSMNENNLNLINQLHDLMLSTETNLKNQANSVIENDAYLNGNITDKSGNITQAGWDWLSQWLVNDNNGGWDANQSIFATINDIIGGAQNNIQGYEDLSLMGPVRSDSDIIRRAQLSNDEIASAVNYNKAGQSASPTYATSLNNRY